MKVLDHALFCHGKNINLLSHGKAGESDYEQLIITTEVNEEVSDARLIAQDSTGDIAAAGKHFVKSSFSIRVAIKIIKLSCGYGKIDALNLSRSCFKFIYCPTRFF